MRLRVLALSLLISAAAVVATATPTLLLDDITVGGTLDRIIPDGGVGDTSMLGTGINSVVQFSGGVGAWTVTSALGDPFLSTPTQANVTLGSAAVRNNSTGNGTLVVAFADLLNGMAAFTAGAPYLLVTITPAGGSQGTVDFFVESGTTTLGLMEGGATQIATAPGPFLFMGGTNLFSEIGVTTGASSQLVVAPVSNYSLGLIAVIRAAQGQQTSFNFQVQAVPEPGFYGLLALGLSVLYYFGIRKRAANGATRTP